MCHQCRRLTVGCLPGVGPREEPDAGGRPGRRGGGEREHWRKASAGGGVTKLVVVRGLRRQARDGAVVQLAL